ncbi:hypothetical protein Bhyg_00418 [Pseudolycoriella hygida]|uniref:Uncharacterized protein n=1 Tax=Pseudolycoriella hygida TaxID=35572 RepID=A0A9Q0S6E7_9DIPT|nr:hypothetical protein Bhyg_00418 [Pseudolycoriella hygida]
MIRSPLQVTVFRRPRCSHVLEVSLGEIRQSLFLFLLKKLSVARIPGRELRAPQIVGRNIGNIQQIHEKRKWPSSSLESKNLIAAVFVHFTISSMMSSAKNNLKKSITVFASTPSGMFGWPKYWSLLASELV